MLRRYLNFVPKVAPSAQIDDSAQVIGNVVIGERARVGANVTIRGDVNSIEIGEDTSIEDNSVLHCEADKFPLIIGKRVTVQHRAAVHGCVLDDDCVIGIGAIVLNGAKVGSASFVGAGSVVAEGNEIPPFSLAEGLPARVVRPLSATEVSERERLRNAGN